MFGILWGYVLFFFDMFWIFLGFVFGYLWDIVGIFFGYVWDMPKSTPRPAPMLQSMTDSK